MIKAATLIFFCEMKLQVIKSFNNWSKNKWINNPYKDGKTKGVTCYRFFIRLFKVIIYYKFSL